MTNNKLLKLILDIISIHINGKAIVIELQNANYHISWNNLMQKQYHFKQTDST